MRNTIIEDELEEKFEQQLACHEQAHQSPGASQPWHQRELCARRDREFMALYHPTLDMMLKRGVPHATRAAAEFTIANGRPHYHVDYENAYRHVCRRLGSSEKTGNGALDHDGDGLAEGRLRRVMWDEITGRVRVLLRQGLSVETALMHVLEHCRASQFFVTAETALTKIVARYGRNRALR